MNLQHCIIRIFANLLFLLAVNSTIAAKSESLKLPSIFGDNMMLQCNKTVMIWGSNKPGSQVVVSVAGQKVSTITGKNGRWQVNLKPIKPGGPFKMTVTDTSTRHCINNIMVGEIWLCGGQSNMKLPLKVCQEGPAVAAKSENPSIRFLTVPFSSKEIPQINFNAQWKLCTPRNALNFSGLAVFYALELNRRLKIPVGVIDCSFGGTQAEAWTAPLRLNTLMLKPIIERYRKAVAEYPQKKKFYDNQKLIYNKLKTVQKLKTNFTDSSTNNDPGGWTKSNFDVSGWQKFWFGNPHEVRWPGGSVMWFRFPLTMPRNWIGKALTLSKFSVSGSCEIFLNGNKIGTVTGSAYQKINLSIPPKMAKRKMLFSIRVYTPFACGAFAGMPTLLCRGVSGEVRLKGWWTWQAEKTLPAIQAGIYPYIFRPRGPGGKDSVGGLYNGMIYPLAPFAVRGVLWYQGEGNHPRAYQYRELLPAMIKSWRNLWREKNLPFILVQLPNYRRAPSTPQSNSYWAELRESQQITAAKDKNAALVTTIDIGDAANIHPENKKDVALRSVLAALKLVYGNSVLSSGPVYSSMKIENDKIRLKFNNIGSGLVSRGGALRHFAIAGKDRKFYWAKAIIDGDNVIVHSGPVAHPVAVRYAWADNPEGCNLYNAEGLPATPFRTDNWPCHSQNRR